MKQLFYWDALISWLPVTLFFVVMSCSCKQVQTEELIRDIENDIIQPSGIHVDYPLTGTIFPPEIPSPLFSWSSNQESHEQWNVSISTQTGKVLYDTTTKSPDWRPDVALWSNLKDVSGKDSLFFTVIGIQKNFWGSSYSSGRISFLFSQDPVDASIFYRAVPLPFSYAVENVHEIEWYIAGIDDEKPHLVLNNIPVCANCHSFSRSGDIAMDIDYANDKGSYIIAPIEDTVRLTFDKVITWSDYKREDGGSTYGLLSQVSPDGRFVLSTVKDRSVFVPVDNLEYSQLFFPIKGIIAYYDRLTNRFSELPGASDKQYVQSNPNWSPDNQEILFARANRYNSAKIDRSESVLLKLEDAEEFISGKKEFKFDLYRIPFNNGKGGKAEPLQGASNNGKSNYFARYSPDGKWVVFCQSSNFMLLQPDSKMYIMPAEGGVPRLMNCNTENMNSWHSWSPNSKWLVFSSKNRGPFTQLYLTHIDENGNDSPPVFLENMAFDEKAINIPEFFTDKDQVLSKMVDQFSQNALYFNRLASSDIQQNKYKDAIQNIEKSIETDSLFYDAYKNRLYINLVLGQARSKDDLRTRITAQQIIEKLIRENPEDLSLYVRRGELRLLMGDDQGALHDGLYVLEQNANNYSGCELITSIYQKMGLEAEAVPYFKKMLQLQPDQTHVSFKLALVYSNINELESALDLLNGIIDRYPNLAAYYIARAGIYIKRGDLMAAKADYDKAIEVEPDNYNCFRERALFYENTSKPDLAQKDTYTALELLSEDIKANPQDASLQFIHAEMLDRTGNIEAALLEYNNYLKQWPPNYTVLKNIAQRLVSMKQWQQAIDTYSLIVENFPEDIKIIFERSLIYQQMGKSQYALDDLNTAILMDPDEFAYYYFRSRLKKQLGDQAGSEEDLTLSAALLEKERSVRKLERSEQDLLTSIRKELANH